MTWNRAFLSALLTLTLTAIVGAQGITELRPHGRVRVRPRPRIAPVTIDNIRFR